jgi:hypothetical protein
MKGEKPLLKILNKIYTPDALIDMKYKGLDVTLKTDKEGNAILMFIGERKANGLIHGNRFSRTFIKDKQGVVIKDHWELKGKVS